MSWKWNPKYLIPWYGTAQALKNVFRDGYQFGDFSAGLLGFDTYNDEPQSTVSDNVSDAFNNHNVSETPDVNGYQQVEVTPADPTSSAANVINYDPNKSASDNMLSYAQANNSASAYDSFLQNKWSQELSDTALSRAIKDAEANGISKYQLFQSGNMAASTPTSAGSTFTSYENAMNRRNSWNEKELAAITAIVVGTVNSALKLLSK